MVSDIPKSSKDRNENLAAAMMPSTSTIGCNDAFAQNLPPAAMIDGNDRRQPLAAMMPSPKSSLRLQ
jgi:hypothetical protein